MVYEAEQAEPRRRVAIKVLHLPTREGQLRFRREARVLAQLRHPGIAQIHAQGVAMTPHGPAPYLVMELVEGGTIRERSAALDRDGRIALLIEICDAVGHAHARGIVHRDL
jgi:serine/threonine protein kinase